MLLNEIQWQNIDTVLMDMDGTLIDLAFDSYFWRDFIPQLVSKQRNLTIKEVHNLLYKQYHPIKNTLTWYSLDFWSQELNLNIYQLTSDLIHNVQVRKDTTPFLQALRQSRRSTILLTNAHPHSLAVKMQHTQLNHYFDLTLSTHQYGYPKEDVRLWQNLHQHVSFNPNRTLFIDDVEEMLDAAKQFGIKYCLGVENPNSTEKNKCFTRHPALDDYRLLIPSLQSNHFD